MQAVACHACKTPLWSGYATDGWPLKGSTSLDPHVVGASSLRAIKQRHILLSGEHSLWQVLETEILRVRRQHALALLLDDLTHKHVPTQKQVSSAHNWNCSAYASGEGLGRLWLVPDGLVGFHGWRTCCRICSTRSALSCSCSSAARSCSYFSRRSSSSRSISRRCSICFCRRFCALSWSMRSSANRARGRARYPRLRHGRHAIPRLRGGSRVGAPSANFSSIATRKWSSSNFSSSRRMAFSCRWYSLARAMSSCQHTRL